MYQKFVNEENVTFISLIMFYEHNNTFFRVFLSVAYTIIDHFICIHYLCIFQDKLSKQNSNFEKKFNDLSRMGIPDILMSIMSCHGFSKKSTFFFTCRSALVHCYISKGLIIVETEEVNLDHVPIRVKNQINSVNLHDEDSLFT